MFVISIQSQVVYGHVGNSAAVYPMQAEGVTVAAIPTTLLSNHPRYPTMRERVLDPELVTDLLLGVEERGLIEQATVLVTGYLGSAAIAAAVADFAERALGRNPKLVYLCDPVMGDDDFGVFVADGIMEVFRERLVPIASLARVRRSAPSRRLPSRAPAGTTEQVERRSIGRGAGPARGRAFRNTCQGMERYSAPPVRKHREPPLARVGRRDDLL
jgi:hypothetical protein